MGEERRTKGLVLRLLWASLDLRYLHSIYSHRLKYQPFSAVYRSAVFLKKIEFDVFHLNGLKNFHFLQ